MNKIYKSRIGFVISIIGSILGIIIGIIEFTIGSKIKELIGYKEDSFTLGIITLLLSIMAFSSSMYGFSKSNLKKDIKFIIFTGQLFPALICFTTVGLLWYIPGTLILFGIIMQIWYFWLNSTQESVIKEKRETYQLLGLKISSKGARILAIIGSILILMCILASFFSDFFSLLILETSKDSIKHSYRTIPFDFIKHEQHKNGINQIEYIEDFFVRIVYVILLIGGVLSLIASLFKSRLFLIIGSIILFAGVMSFLLFLPFIFNNVGYKFNEGDNIISLGLGWYLALLSGFLIFLGGLFIEN